MILSLGPWDIEPKARQEIKIPFGATAKPKLVLSKHAGRRIRLVTLEIDGNFTIEKFGLNGEEELLGACSARMLCQLFPSLHWPALAPGSKMHITVRNPYEEYQVFAPVFVIQTL